MNTIHQINMFHQQYPKNAKVYYQTQSKNGILVECNGVEAAAIWDGQYWQEYDIDESQPKKILRRVDNQTPVGTIEATELRNLFDGMTDAELSA